MSPVSHRELEALGEEARHARLLDLREEMMQLNAEKSLGGHPSNIGAYKATSRSISRMLTHMHNDQ